MLGSVLASLAPSLRLGIVRRLLAALPPDVLQELGGPLTIINLLSTLSEHDSQSEETAIVHKLLLGRILSNLIHTTVSAIASVVTNTCPDISATCLDNSQKDYESCSTSDSTMPVMSSHCNQTLPALSRFYTDIENNFDDTGQSCGGSNLYSRCFHNPDASMSVFSVSKSSQILRVPFCKPFSSAEMPPPETDITLSDSDSNHSIDVSSNTSNTHNFSCLVSVAKSNSDTDIDTNVPKDDEMLRDSCEANSSPGAKKETHSNRVGSCDATRSDSNQHSAGLGNIMDADCGFLAAFQIDDFTEIFDRAAISLSRISETPQWLIDAGTVLGTFDTILSVCNRLAYDYVHYTMQFLKQLPIFNELTTREKVDLLGNSVSGVMLTMMSDGYRKKSGRVRMAITERLYDAFFDFNAVIATGFEAQIMKLAAILDDLDLQRYELGALAYLCVLTIGAEDFTGTVVRQRTLVSALLRQCSSKHRSDSKAHSRSIGLYMETTASLVRMIEGWYIEVSNQNMFETDTRRRLNEVLSQRALETRRRRRESTPVRRFGAFPTDASRDSLVVTASPLCALLDENYDPSNTETSAPFFAPFIASSPKRSKSLGSRPKSGVTHREKDRPITPIASFQRKAFTFSVSANVESTTTADRLNLPAGKHFISQLNVPGVMSNIDSLSALTSLTGTTRSKTTGNRDFTKPPSTGACCQSDEHIAADDVVTTSDGAGKTCALSPGRDRIPRPDSRSIPGCRMPHSYSNLINPRRLSILDSIEKPIKIGNL